MVCAHISACQIDGLVSLLIHLDGKDDWGLEGISSVEAVREEEKLVYPVYKVRSVWAHVVYIYANTVTHVHQFIYLVDH